jgi:hypothetical protein
MTWDEALDAFEASLSEVERALDQGAWTGWRGPQGLPTVREVPTAAHEARLQELQMRCERSLIRLRAGLAEVVAQHAALDRRRQATRSYLGSQVLPARRVPARP